MRSLLAEPLHPRREVVAQEGHQYYSLAPAQIALKSPVGLVLVPLEVQALPLLPASLSAAGAGAVVAEAVALAQAAQALLATQDL